MKLPTGAIVVLGIVAMLCFTIIVVAGMTMMAVLAVCAAIIVCTLKK